jgi:hypothetical protein
MSGHRAFDPDELRGADGPEATEAEVAGAWTVARELDALTFTDGGRLDRSISQEGTGPSMADAAFVDRVMAAIEHEPAPRPASAGGRAIRQARPLAVVASIRDAWRVAFGGKRPMGARLGALAYVLVATVVMSSFAGAAIFGTAALLAPAESPVPTASQPVPDPSASQSPGPSGPSLEPTDGAATPDGSPDESEEPGESPEPGESHEPEGAGSTQPAGSVAPTPSASDDDHSPVPSGIVESSPSATPESSRTPMPSTSPSASPSETPKPSSSNSSPDGA